MNLGNRRVSQSIMPQIKTKIVKRTVYRWRNQRSDLKKVQSMLFFSQTNHLPVKKVLNKAQWTKKMKHQVNDLIILLREIKLNPKVGTQKTSLRTKDPERTTVPIWVTIVDSPLGYWTVEWMDAVKVVKQERECTIWSVALVSIIHFSNEKAVLFTIFEEKIECVRSISEFLDWGVMLEMTKLLENFGIRDWWTAWDCTLEAINAKAWWTPLGLIWEFPFDWELRKASNWWHCSWEMGHCIPVEEFIGVKPVESIHGITRTKAWTEIIHRIGGWINHGRIRDLIHWGFSFELITWWITMKLIAFICYMPYYSTVRTNRSFLVIFVPSSKTISSTLIRIRIEGIMLSSLKLLRTWRCLTSWIRN